MMCRFILVLSVVCSMPVAYYIPRTDHSRLLVPIVENKHGYLCTYIVVKDKKCIFILDTGAVGSFIDKKYLSNSELKWNSVNAKFSFTGSKETPISEYTTLQNIEIEKTKFMVSSKFYNIDMDNINKYFSAGDNNMVVSGILGLDAMKELGMIINVGKMEVCIIR